MQENHRNGQDASDIVETSKPFTTTWATLNRHIVLSAAQARPVTPPGGNFNTTTQLMMQEIMSCIMVFIQAILS